MADAMKWGLSVCFGQRMVYHEVHEEHERNGIVTKDLRINVFSVRSPLQKYRYYIRYAFILVLPAPGATVIFDKNFKLRSWQLSLL
jgi:hypothetical protein